MFDAVIVGEDIDLVEVIVGTDNVPVHFISFTVNVSPLYIDDSFYKI